MIDGSGPVGKRPGILKTIPRCLMGKIRCFQFTVMLSVLALTYTAPPDESTVTVSKVELFRLIVEPP